MSKAFEIRQDVCTLSPCSASKIMIFVVLCSFGVEFFVLIQIIKTVKYASITPFFCAVLTGKGIPKPIHPYVAPPKVKALFYSATYPFVLSIEMVDVAPSQPR